MDEIEHERLSNITLRHKVVFYFIHYGILSDIVPPEFCCKKCGKT